MDTTTKETEMPATATTPKRLYLVTWKNGNGSHEVVCCDACFRHIGWAQPKPLNWMTTPAARSDEPVAHGDCDRCEYTETSCRSFERRNSR